MDHWKELEDIAGVQVNGQPMEDAISNLIASFREKVTTIQAQSFEIESLAEQVVALEDRLAKAEEPESHAKIEEEATLPPAYYCRKYKLIEQGHVYDRSQQIEAMAKHLIERTRILCEKQYNTQRNLFISSPKISLCDDPYLESMGR